MHIWDLWEVLLHLPGGLMIKLNKEDRGYHRLRFSALFWNVKLNGDFFCCCWFKLVWPLSESNSGQKMINLSHYRALIKRRYFVYLARMFAPIESNLGPLWCSTLSVLSINTYLALTVWWALVVTVILQRACCPEELRAVWHLLRAGWLPHGLPWPYVLHELSWGTVMLSCVASRELCRKGGVGLRPGRWEERTDMTRVRIRISLKASFLYLPIMAVAFITNASHAGLGKGPFCYLPATTLVRAVVASPQTATKWALFFQPH